MDSSTQRECYFSIWDGHKILVAIVMIIYMKGSFFVFDHIEILVAIKCIFLGISFDNPISTKNKYINKEIDSNFAYLDWDTLFIEQFGASFKGIKEVNNKSIC